jgi:hypothetical protein
MLGGGSKAAKPKASSSNNGWRAVRD